MHNRAFQFPEQRWVTRSGLGRGCKAGGCLSCECECSCSVASSRPLQILQLWWLVAVQLQAALRYHISKLSHVRCSPADTLRRSLPLTSISS